MWDLTLGYLLGLDIPVPRTTDEDLARETKICQLDAPEVIPRKQFSGVLGSGCPKSPMPIKPIPPSTTIIKQ